MPLIEHTLIFACVTNFSLNSFKLPIQCHCRLTILINDVYYTGMTYLYAVNTAFKNPVVLDFNLPPTLLNCGILRTPVPLASDVARSVVCVLGT